VHKAGIRAERERSARAPRDKPVEDRATWPCSFSRGGQGYLQSHPGQESDPFRVALDLDMVVMNTENGCGSSGS
jgi:hypothetical protein